MGSVVPNQVRVRSKLVVDRIACGVFCHGDRFWVKGDDVGVDWV